MKRISFFATIVFLVCLSTIQAQNVKRPETFNYLRGHEALQENKIEEALEYFNKDIQENPKNGYSFAWIATIRERQEEYGRALTAADFAIKYIPKKDVDYVAYTYSIRANVYLHLEDTVKALADYSTAVRLMPEETKPYEERAQVYYEQGRYDLADADYKKMVELKPGDVMGYMGLGRNANAQKKWSDAIKQFDYVTKLESEYSSGYAFRAESYIGLEKWSEATDDIVSALSIEWDGKAVYLANTLEEPAFTMMISKLKVQSAKSPNEVSWPYLVGLMFERKGDYSKAIDNYKEANKRNASPQVIRRISQCYYEKGLYEEALAQIDLALNMDSTNLNNLAHRANIFYEMGNVKKAIEEWDHVLASEPEYAYGYYRRGWFKELAGDIDGAIEDLSMCTVLDPNYSYAWGTRGDIYNKVGKKELAEADFNKVIELEDTPDKYEYLHYAYQGLGQNEKAIAVMNEIIAKDSIRAGSYYDAACLYSRMKDKANSIMYLEKALKLGYNRFSHMERDYDLDDIRNMEEYKALIEKYREETLGKPTAVGAFLVESAKDETVTEIPFIRENGVYKVKCEINNLPLHFIFDTGASDVSLSMVEATFMMKNGYLTANDVIGNQRYLDANGNVSVGTTVNLRNVYFAGFELTNVRASVVRNQNAPLLLGQSVLGRLGKIEIDNGKGVIKITH